MRTAWSIFGEKPHFDNWSRGTSLWSVKTIEDHWRRAYGVMSAGLAHTRLVLRVLVGTSKTPFICRQWSLLICYMEWYMEPEAVKGNQKDRPIISDPQFWYCDLKAIQISCKAIRISCKTTRVDTRLTHGLSTCWAHEVATSWLMICEEPSKKNTQEKNLSMKRKHQWNLSILIK